MSFCEIQVRKVQYNTKETFVSFNWVDDTIVFLIFPIVGIIMIDSQCKSVNVQSLKKEWGRFSGLNCQ